LAPGGENVLYLLSFVAAIQIVAAQALWKRAVDDHAFRLTRDYIGSAQFLGLVTSPGVLLGVALYASSTLVYLSLLARYEFAVVQSLVVVSALLIAFLIGGLIFREHISGVQLLGLGFLLVGVWLVSTG
jgi:drug/metabolite transporter (DMT)-like permease